MNARQSYKEWWFAKVRWHKDVLAYFDAMNSTKETLPLEKKCAAGIKKMCEAAYQAGRKESCS